MTNPNDPAFPSTNAEGLTKREYFSIVAMHDMITQMGYPFSADEMARRSVEYADSLIAKLNK